MDVGGIGVRFYSILTNEKYMGDALLQKTYTPNFLTHKSIANNRAIRQYYVENPPSRNRCQENLETGAKENYGRAQKENRCINGAPHGKMKVQKAMTGAI